MYHILAALRLVILVSVLVSAGEQLDPWNTEFGGTPDLSFSGITTFAHLPHERCLERPEAMFDVALLGIPFDTAVSFRPGEY